MDVATIEPSTITAGDTVSWKKTLPDYPATAGWALTYAIKGPTAIAAITAAASGDDHLISITAAATTAWAAGDYWWTGYVTKGSERHQVASGTLKVRPNLATVSSTYDGRSHVKKTLDALEAVIEGRASKDQMAYTIQGRSLSRIPPAELLTWRDKYLREHQAEQQAERVSKGLGNGRNIRVRF